MARHRLTQDFANRTDVRFLTCYGELLRTGYNDSFVATVDRPLSVGNTWEEGE
ncbi:hypothetical protein SEA_SORORFAGO_94 [Mycobacterium phage SororFago]|nr:hypothetical protein SEA_SORORFAGO_94 [Mycobacterium phage SororFago]